MTRPLTARISIAAMAANLARARACAPASWVWAVVKADAYGHGLDRALEGFAQADGLALLEFDRAQQLRARGWRKPVLMLEGAFGPDDIAIARRHRLGLVVHSAYQLDWLEVGGGGHPPAVFLKFNSGMNRLGFVHGAFRDAHARLVRMRSARKIGEIVLATHFANSDLPGGAHRAIAAFDAACEGLEGERSAANSAAVIDLPQSHHQWVRPGIMLYGASPYADRSAASLGLVPAMTLRSRLIATQSLEPGESVGYGSTFVADHPMRIGVVACGYADGYPRHAPTGTPVIVAGVRTRTVGRVAMDMLMVDLDPVPEAVAGSEVELWGENLPIDEVAASAGTIGYELMCAIAPRVAIEVVR
jgi:alanine racemase